MNNWIKKIPGDWDVRKPQKIVWLCAGKHCSESDSARSAVLACAESASAQWLLARSLSPRSASLYRVWLRAVLAVRSHLKFEYLCENELLRKTILTCLLVAQIILKLKKSQKISWHCHFNICLSNQHFLLLASTAQKSKKAKKMQMRTKIGQKKEERRQ